MARMTLQDLLRKNIAGQQILDPLAKQVGIADWQIGDGMNEGGAMSQTGVVDPGKLAALQGYTFDWQNTGPANSGTLTAFDPSGAQIGQYAQEDQTAAQGLGEWAALAAAGFGGAGLLGLGPLGGALGGLGGASTAGGGAPAIGNGAFLGETAAGLGGSGAITGGGGLSAGLGGAAGGGLSAGGGLMSPQLAAMGAGGAGLGGAGGAAGGGSFWGGLAKAAIGPALSTGVQMIGANQAAKAQQDATSKSNELQRYVYDTTRADNMPALQARNSALQQMQALLADPSSLTKQPGYQFGMDQGTKTLQNGAAARGMTYSGAQGKALQRFGQDYAGSKIDQSFNRLSALASGGQPGAGTIAGAAGNYGQTVGNNLTAMGDANAARYIVGGNAVGNAVNGLTAYGQRQGWWGG